MLVVPSSTSQPLLRPLAKRLLLPRRLKLQRLPHPLPQNATPVAVRDAPRTPSPPPPAWPRTGTHLPPPRANQTDSARESDMSAATTIAETPTKTAERAGPRPSTKGRNRLVEEHVALDLGIERFARLAKIGRRFGTF